MDYQEKDSSSVLSFNPYFAGAAPVRLENLCKKIGMIAYKQAYVISPFFMFLLSQKYTNFVLVDSCKSHEKTSSK